MQKKIDNILLRERHHLMTSVQSLTEYIDRIHDVLISWNHDSALTHPWFRGHSREDWELIPSLYRESENGDREREMLRDFKLRCHAFLDYTPSNDMELFFAMQHYGMPTRLIDWTESHLAALFFAVNNYENETDAAVWILGPSTLNKSSNSGLGDRVPMSDHKIFEKYTFNVDAKNLKEETILNSDHPIAVRPKRSTARIVAQRGMFTIHGEEQKGIDLYMDEFSGMFLDKIIISGKSKQRPLKELYVAGVSYAALFPELQGLCKEITYRYSKDYFKTPLKNRKGVVP